MTAIKIATVLAGLLFVIDVQAVTPTFAMPAGGAGAANACRTDALSITRTEDNTAVSILRKQTQFLSVGAGQSSRARAKCDFRLAFEQPLQRPATLLIDLRGTEFKAPRAEISLDIQLGDQRHQISYRRGSVVAAGDGIGFRRFLIELPRRATDFKIAIKAKGASLDGTDAAHISLDSFDACFITDSTMLPQQCAAPQK